jgi:hypothetical protein
MVGHGEDSSGTYRLVSPLGLVQFGSAPRGQARVRSPGPRPVLGIIDNGKPNVAQFLQGSMAAAAMGAADFEVLPVVKPRSAAACPDLEELIDRCDVVINAVAD